MCAQRSSNRQRNRNLSAPYPAAATEVTPEVREEIRALSRQAVPPRQIARRTGLPPALVVEELRALMHAEYHAPDAHAIVGSWVNAGWSRGLAIPDEYLDLDPDADAFDGTDGLAIVAVARREPRGALRVCQYLLDVYCLGVKNTTGPLVIPTDELDGLLVDFYRSFRGYLPVPSDLAHQLVWGAFAYAETLGFAPPAHSDWRKTRGHLDERPNSIGIEFGRDGKPFYVNGPHDNTDHVLSTLRRTVGDDGFHYALGLN
jgi:hypothetical protein